MNIKLLKLTTGETLIGEIKEQNEKELQMINICVIVYAKEGVLLLPWLPINKNEKVTINLKNVVVLAESKQIDNELVFRYRSIFSGLEIPTLKTQTPKDLN